MEIYHYKKASTIDPNTLFELVDKDRDMLTTFFPITMSETATLEKTKDYLTNLSQQFEKKEMLGYGVFEREKLIGLIHVKNIDWRVPKCELGYFLGADYFRKGIMTTVLANLIQHCFEEYKMVKIFARTSQDNKASQNLVKKLGFELEGVLRKEFVVGAGEIIDVLYFGLINPDFT